MPRLQAVVRTCVRPCNWRNIVLACVTSCMGVSADLVVWHCGVEFGRYISQNYCKTLKAMVPQLLKSACNVTPYFSIFSKFKNW